ncbi:zinc finger protein [Macleaya cordata]|uniref:Zinc finger protein n=1 Tax=Macleaya cordata TaxID=56857 RepID=A0A200R0R6_MACCD|nr:zinc finger protein [Macleaya cordata]
MPGLTCNACNSEFDDDSQQKLHYKSEWHRYNLKRKVAGVPGVTEALFLARQSALAQEQKKLTETPMLYSCALCQKEYRSSKAHGQHLKSRSHMMRASQGSSGPQTIGATVIRPLTSRVANKPLPPKEVESEESEDEWVEVDEDDDLVGDLTNLNVEEPASDGEMDEDEELEVDPSCCFICDLMHDSIEICMVHMHKRHGFFIPDIEFLKDPKGLLTYLGLKVKRDFICLYCNDRCHPFNSLEAVRKHMVAKSHCKVRYGDGGDDEEVELEDFYDYSSSYMDEDGKQLVTSDDMTNTVELGSGGSELVQEHGVGNGAIKSTNGEDESVERDESVRGGVNAFQDGNEE